MACDMDHKGLKGLLWMGACCAAPLVLGLALPVLGIGLGGRTAPVVGALTALACPVSMLLMLWMMRRQRAGAPAIHPRTVPIGLTRGQYGTSNTRCQPPCRHGMTAGERQERGGAPARGRLSQRRAPPLDERNINEDTHEEHV
jgi:hypothetical protein